MKCGDYSNIMSKLAAGILDRRREFGSQLNEVLATYQIQRIIGSNKTVQIYDLLLNMISSTHRRALFVCQRRRKQYYFKGTK